MIHLNRLAVFACLAVAVATPALAAEMLDQQHLPPVGTGATNVSNFFDNVQTFTVGKAGYLTRVEINIKRGTGTTQPINLSIWNMSGNTLDGKLTEASLSNGAVGEDFAFISFGFGTKPTVSIGDMLAIKVVSAAENTTAERYQWTRGDAYDGGGGLQPIPDRGAAQLAG